LHHNDQHNSSGAGYRFLQRWRLHKRPPPWGGTTAEWTIVTDSDVAAGATNSYTLRNNLLVGDATLYLSTQRTTWGSSQSWSFWMGILDKTPSAIDNNSIWLWANESNLVSGTIDGYRVNFGQVGADNIFLQIVTNGLATNIITSTGAVPTLLTDFGFMVRVTRSSGSVWTLYTSSLPTTSGTGNIATEIPSKANTPISQGSITDITYTDFSNGYFGFETGFTNNTGVNAEFDQLYFDTSSDASLPVTLSSFTATAGDGKVALNWSTESEIENLGFNIYRSTKYNPPAGGQLSMINDQLIPGAGNSSSRHDYEYVDNGLTNGVTYWYKLEDVDYTGNTELHGPISATPIESAFPAEFRLYPNYPNPFNPVTTISYDLPEEGYVELTVYNMRGEKVTTLLKNNQAAGSYKLNWDGTDRNGGIVSSGLYILRIASGSYSRTSKMVFIR